jgi:hypothetical protein
MPEPSSTPAHLDPEEALRKVHDAEASRLADALSNTYHCTDLMAAEFIERKVRAHRTIDAEDLPGLPEGTVFSCSHGYIHMVREDGKLDSLTLGQGPLAPAFPATVLQEAGDDL